MLWVGLIPMTIVVTFVCLGISIGSKQAHKAHIASVQMANGHTCKFDQDLHHLRSAALFLLPSLDQISHATPHQGRCLIRIQDL